MSTIKPLHIKQKASSMSASSNPFKFKASIKLRRKYQSVTLYPFNEGQQLSYFYLSLLFMTQISPLSMLFFSLLTTQNQQIIHPKLLLCVPSSCVWVDMKSSALFSSPTNLTW